MLLKHPFSPIMAAILALVYFLTAAMLETNIDFLLSGAHEFHFPIADEQKIRQETSGCGMVSLIRGRVARELHHSST